MSEAVLGIDPGTRKFGFAVTTAFGLPAEAMGIQPIERLPAFTTEILAGHGIRAIVLGRGTNAEAFAAALSGHGIPVHLVDERETTLLARGRYFADNPPRGWRRLVPRGMLLPPRPIDDYAALLIAERFLAAEQGAPPGRPTRR